MRDGFDTGFFARADVGARMPDQKWHAKRLASLQLVDEPLDRTLAHLLVGRAQIEQVGVMGDDHPDAGLGLRAFERLDFLFGIWLCRPPAGGLCGNLVGTASALSGA